MQIHVEIDPSCKEPQVTIRTDSITEEINEMISQLSMSQQKLLAGFDADSVQLLDTAEVIRFFARSQKVFAQTVEHEYVIRLRLYELEQRLSKTMFVRISNSEIVNLKAIRKLDLSFTGTIAILLSNGESTYVSRRHVAEIKERLGLERRDG